MNFNVNFNRFNKINKFCRPGVIKDLTMRLKAPNLNVSKAKENTDQILSLLDLSLAG
jgi:hypothetical protein